MSLKLAMKPNEKLIVGGAVIRNGPTSSHIFIENNVPVLRQNDIITEAMATTPCRRIYLAIQLMYIDEKSCESLHPVYWELVKGVIEAAPSSKDLISLTSQYMLEGNYYKALKQAKKLIIYEEELINNATKST